MGVLKRAGLVAAMSLASVNVFTGSPLMALWIASRANTAGLPVMPSFGLVAIVMGALSLLLVRALGRLGSAYDRLTGRQPQTRQHTPWLRSMRGERPHEVGVEYTLSALEKVLVLTVVVAVVAFEVWFFFLSGSPIGQTSGRGN